jgi:predicted RNase H-like nuclease (RuvC/YqgF family)
MPLKAKVSEDEYQALSEPLREFYTKSGDGYRLDAEGVEDVGGLKKVLEDKKSDVAKLRAKIEELTRTYDGLDPAEARAALEERQKMHDRKLIDEGKVEELVSKRTERLKAEAEAQARRLQKELENATQERDNLHKRLSEHLIDSGLATAAAKANVRPTAVVDLLLRGRNVWKIQDGQPVPFRDDGSPLFGKNAATPMSMEEWVASLQTEAPHLFESNKGAGSEPSASRISGTRITLTREQARDRRTWLAAEDQAKRTGGQVVVQD